MTDEPAQDRSISVGRDAINSTLITGDRNVVKIYNMGWREDDAPERAKLFGANPYRGMVAFTEADAERFYGRGELVGRLWERFRDLSCAEPGDGTCRLLPILGPSGSGKSSVARAGLLAELARRPLPGRTGQRVAVFTPGARPLEALANILARVATDDPMPLAKSDEFQAVLERGEEGARHGLRRIAGMLPNAATEPLVVLVDQFEELFSLCRDAEHRKIFIETLLDAASDVDGTLSVIITLRTDFLGQTQAHNALNQVIARQGVLVPTMSEAELRLAVAEPARKAGHPIDPDTIRRLVLETEGREGALPLLQFMLVKIWEGMADGRKPEDTVNDLGGVGGAVAATANTIYEKLPPEEQEIARRAFLAMVTFNADRQPTRRRAPVSEMVGAGEDAAVVRRVLERFADYQSRLIVLSAAADGEQTAEVTHEALFGHWDQLKTWLDEGREDLRFHQRVADAARDWRADGEPTGSLWRPPNLDLLQAYAERAGHGLTQIEADFLQASAATMAEEVRQQRRQKSNILAAAAFQALRDDDPPLALLLGLEALPGDDPGSPDYDYAEAGLVAAVLSQAELWRSQSESLDIVQLSPDGAALLISGDMVTVMYDTLTGAMLKVFHDAGSPRLLSFDPAGERVLAAFWEGSTKILPLDGGPVCLDPVRSGAWRDAAFSPDGRRVATGGEDGVVRVWDPETGQVLVSMDGKAGRIRAMAWSPDGNVLVTAADDEEGARLWNSRTGEALGKLEQPGSVHYLAYSPTGTRVSSGGWGETAYVWDPVSQKQLFCLEGHYGLISGVGFSPDGERVLTWSEDGTVRLWEDSWDTHGNGDEPSSPLDWTPIMVAHVLQGHEGPVTCASFTTDGQRIITGSKDFTARIWDLDGKCLAVLRGHQAELTYAACPAADPRVAVTASKDGSVRVWEILRGAPAVTYEPPDQAQGMIQAAAFSEDATRVIAAYGDGVMVTWDAATGEVLGTSHGPEFPNRPVSMMFSRDGALAAFALDGCVQVCDTRDGSLRTSLDTGDEFVSRLAFSPDGEHLLSSGQAARLWNLSTGEVRHAWDFAGGGIAFAHAGDRFFLGAYEGGVLTGEDDVDVRLAGGLESQGCGAFSPDGQTLVTAGKGVLAYVWDGKTGELRYTLKGHKGLIADVAVSPDGNLIATASLDHTVRLWDAALGQPLSTFRKHTAPIVAVAFSPTGDSLLSVADDKVAHLWYVDAARGRELREYAAKLVTRDFTFEERRRFGLPPPVVEPSPEAEPTEARPAAPPDQAAG